MPTAAAPIPCLLTCGPLASLLRARSLVSALPLAIVSPRRQLHFASALGVFASGPLSALQVPARQRLVLEEDDAGDACFLVLAEAGDPTRAPWQRDLLPSRIPIELDVFAALLALAGEPPRTRRVGGSDASGGVARWLRRDAARRRHRCSGARVSRGTLDAWSGRVRALEDGLVASALAGETAEPIVAAWSRADARRFLRVVGFAPRRYLAEFRLRAALLRMQANDAAPAVAAHAALARAFERAHGEHPLEWIARSHLLRDRGRARRTGATQITPRCPGA